MSKVSAKPAEKAQEEILKAQEEAFSAFDTTKAVDQIRAFAEQGMAQSKEAYAKLKVGAEDAQKSIETTFETARSAGADLSLKAISAYRAGVEADLAHIEALVGVGSFAQFVELQTAFMRARFEMVVSQGKEMQKAAAKASQDIASPSRKTFEKIFNELKAA